VPSRLKRYYGAGDFHFITCSCYRRQPLLNTPARRDLFLRVLEEVRIRYAFVVAGYVVMPEHFHLLMSEPETDTPSLVLQALRQSAPAFHVWQRRFYDFNVWTERKRIEKLRYMHRNPVKRGLVKEPEQWMWSSFRSYAYGESGLVQINDGQVLKLKTHSVGT